MPDEYREFDIAAHVIDCCKTDAELQRVAQELLLYQERDLFNLLRYLKYLVDTMRDPTMLFGVLVEDPVWPVMCYTLLGVHRVDSMYYDLDPTEFLR